jgi:hypothetical protein
VYLLFESSVIYIVVMLYVRLETHTGMSGGGSRLDAQRRTNSALSSSRNLSGPLGMGAGLDSGLSVSNANRAGNRPRSASGAAVENDRILQSLLNLIETLADDSINATRTQLNTFGAGAAGTLGVAAITKILVKSAPNSGTAGLTDDSDSVSVTSAPAGTVLSIPPPAGITRQNSLSSHSSAGAGGLSEYAASTQEQEILRQGAIFFSPLMRVDSAAVMCSAALCNLSEIPQCRPGLVSSGALKMIKRWLEIGIDVLAQARVLCFNRLSSPRPSTSRTSPDGNAQRFSGLGLAEEHERQAQQNQTVRDSCNAFIEAFGPAYELISNAAATLMHLSGGTDCRFTALNAAIATTTPRHGHGRSGPNSGNGGRDYIVGWIDAQILAEGLPAVVSSFIALCCSYCCCPWVNQFSCMLPVRSSRELPHKPALLAVSCKFFSAIGF